MIFATTLAATGLPVPFSFASAPPAVHPQLLLMALGPGSGNLPVDVLHLGPEAEPGRAPLAVAGLAIACWDWDTEPMLSFADTAAGDGTVGVANLTAVALLLALTAAPPFLVSSSTLLREDVDMFSEDDDFLFKSNNSNRLCDAKLGLDFLDLSMSAHSCRLLEKSICLIKAVYV